MLNFILSFTNIKYNDFAFVNCNALKTSKVQKVASEYTIHHNKD